MKILSLKSLNINSLVGEVEIDFAELTKDSSLFAITGPTGSGKSTLLDIISCALYGRTARLKNPNDLMSRHSGECYCEVEFEIREKRYRSSWSQKRAHNKHDGKLQTAKMELIDLAEEKVLPLKSKEVPKKIEELSGLDFGRFTQSMMLAQGGFDAFLKADEKERSALLEKITGTQIYADISVAIFDKHRNYAQDIESDQKILESIVLLDDEVIDEKQKNLDLNISQKKKTDIELQTIRSALNWVQKLSELIADSKKHEDEFLLAKKSKDEHKDDFEKLALANRALNVSSTFTVHNQLQKSIDSDKSTLVNLTKELEKLQQDIKQKTKEYDVFNKEFIQNTTEFESQNKKLKLARDIKTQEVEVSKNIAKEQLILEQKKEELEKLTKTLKTLVDNYKTIDKKIEIQRSYLANNSQDEKLTSNLAVIEQTLIQYKAETEIISTKQEEAGQLTQSLQQEQIKFDLLKEEVDRLSDLYNTKELEYKKLNESSSSDSKIEETILKSLKDVETLRSALDNYTKLTQKRDNEIEFNENNTIQEKALQESQKLLQQHIKGIKEHIETLRDKKDKEQLIKPKI